MIISIININLIKNVILKLLKNLNLFDNLNNNLLLINNLGFYL